MTDKVEEKTADKKQEPGVPDISQVLAAYDKAPSQADIELWKNKYGDIFVSGFSDTELFVWRPLQRGEYVNLQKQLRTPATDGSAPTELDFEEWVVEACVLWSSDDKLVLRKGGTIGTLSEQIMSNSNFMPPNYAALLVAKL